MEIDENCTIAYILIYATNYVVDHLVKARDRKELKKGSHIQGSLRLMCSVISNGQVIVL